MTTPPVSVAAAPTYVGATFTGGSMSSYTQIAKATVAVKHALFLLALLLVRKAFLAPPPPPPSPPVGDGFEPMISTAPPGPLPALPAE